MTCYVLSGTLNCTNSTQLSGVKLSDKVACDELRDRLGLEDVVTIAVQ